MAAVPDQDLPFPVTQADQYLYDIALSLRALNAVMANWMAALALDAETARAAAIRAAEDKLLMPIPLREQSQRKQHKGNEVA